ncbi:MAG: glycosyltransferase, partial [Abditibacteriota bacterium]|nr:glycosyltransferase [Abditibacteriota bacterium]
LALAFEGITSFSVKPIRMALSLSGFALLVSVVILIYSIVRHMQGNTVPGWASLSVSIWFLGVLRLLMIGIVGEYVGKVYLETKHRPKYIIKDIINPE